jgi:hypothetical protein
VRYRIPVILLSAAAVTLACAAQSETAPLPPDRYPGTVENLEAYFEANAASLDPIEGIWSVAGEQQSGDRVNVEMDFARVAIIRERVATDWDFVEVVVASDDVESMSVSAVYSETAHESVFLSRQREEDDSWTTYEFRLNPDGTLEGLRRFMDGNTAASASLRYIKLAPKSGRE